jgi:hypothetical protein
MEKTKPVHIQGDKEAFVSKNAIERLKKDMREGIPNEASSYLLEGWDYQIVDDNDNECRISIIKINLENKGKGKKVNNPVENKLKNKLRSLKENRQSEKVTIHQMQKKRGDVEIPTEISETYAKLKKSGNPVLSPLDALENAEDLKKTIEMLNGVPSSNPFAEYYRSLKRWLEEIGK